MTAKEYIDEAAEMIGSFDAGQEFNTSEYERALSLLTRFLNGLKSDRLFAYSVGPVQFNLVANTQSYTYGSGGDFDATRPAFIQGGLVVLSSERTPLDMLNADQWRAIPEFTTALRPRKCFDDGGYPLRTLYFEPKPSGTPVVELYPWVHVEPVDDVDTEVVAPPEYERFITHNLAAIMAGPFGMQLPETVNAIAVSSKAEIRAKNALLMDPSLPPPPMEAPTRGKPLPPAPPVGA